VLAVGSDAGATGGASRIPRPQIAARLGEALDRGSVVLIAGAGCGKTTALEEVLAQREGATAWVRCTALDADPGRLVSHLVDAVRGVAPGTTDVLAEQLSRATERIEVALAVRALLSELDRLLVDPLTIAVDDAEHLGAGAAAVVSDLFGAGIVALRVAVASRRPLPVRTAKLRAEGRLTEIDAADLAFTPDECAAVMAARLGRDPADAELEALWSATEGWPLGVALGGTRPEGFVVEEVLDPLEPTLRRELVDSSVAPDLDPAMAAALELGGGFLEAVRAQGVPVRELGDGRLAYHPLVREVLLARLLEERPEERRLELHAACAAALEAAERGPEAVEHWLDARSPESAAAVARHGHLLVRTAPDTVTRWLEALPADAPADPSLRLLEGRLAAGAARLEEAAAPLRAAVDAYAERGEPEAEWLARLALGDVLMLLQDFDATVPLADGFEDAHAFAAPMVAVSCAAAHSRAGRFDAAGELLARAVAHRSGIVTPPIAALFRGYYLDFPRGRLDAALDGMQQGLAELERSDPFNRLPYMLGLTAFVHDERGEDAAAFALAERAERLTERTVLGGYIGDVARRSKATANALAGRFAEAELELSRTAAQTPHSYFAGEADLAATAIALGRGDVEAALEAARRSIEHGGLDSWLSRRRSTAILAPLLVEAGRVDWARSLVEEALGARPPAASVARLLVLRAWLRGLDGDADGALDDVEAAWADAGADAVHLVRRERPRIEPLLWDGLGRGALDPAAVVTALDAAAPGGAAVLALTRHPVPAVRRATLPAVAASGHPAAARRVAELEEDADEAVAAAARATAGRVVLDPPPLVFALLGSFAVRRGAFAIPEDAWERRAAQRLVRYLLLHRDRPVPEDELFAAFWPDRSATAARRSLHVAASSARAALDPDGAEESVLEAAQRAYRLRLGDRDVVDVDEFDRVARTALAAAGTARLDLLETAAARWTGEPLPEDRYEDWAAAPREQLLDLHGRVLGALAEARAAAGDPNGAIDAWRALADLDPLDEAAHRGLMVAYARSGRRGHALRQYLSCRRLLVDELGVEPAAETTTLQRRVLAGDTV
jgi:DNA-binding SARP family transcriptional activator